jgi:hypothetical protein
MYGVALAFPLFLSFSLSPISLIFYDYFPHRREFSFSRRVIRLRALVRDRRGELGRKLPPPLSLPRGTPLKINSE